VYLVLPDVEKGNDLMLTRLTPVATLVSAAGLPDWTFLGPNLHNLDHFNRVWTKKNYLDLWTFRA